MMRSLQGAIDLLDRGRSGVVHLGGGRRREMLSPVDCDHGDFKQFEPGGEWPQIAVHQSEGFEIDETA